MVFYKRRDTAAEQAKHHDPDKPQNEHKRDVTSERHSARRLKSRHGVRTRTGQRHSEFEQYRQKRYQRERGVQRAGYRHKRREFYSRQLSASVFRRSHNAFRVVDAIVRCKIRAEEHGGRITMGSRYTMSREAKIRHLSDEGISTEAFGNDLVRVVNYKDYLFDLSVIDPSDIISNPGTENTTDSVIRTFLMDSDKIKGVPDEMLMMISEERCSANDTADRIKMLENINRELERRKNKRK